MINRIKNSLIARTQNRMSKNFEHTKWGKFLLELKGIHKGEKCFIIGNGPSLLASDLQKIDDLNIPTFASNRIYNIFDQTNWRPTYYASEDIIVLKDIQEIISSIPARNHFIPINLKWFEGINIPNADYFWMDYNSENEDTYNLSLDVAHAIRCKGTVTITCIQLAIYMGFSEIYLIGVDHNYSKMIDVNGEIIENSTIKDYFTDKYDEDIKEQLVHDIGGTTRAFIDVEQLSRKIGNFRVYNATRGGKLEVFQRVDIDKFFKEVNTK